MDKIEVIVGTYEEFLVGYRTEKSNGKITMTQSFADRSHAGSVRSLAVSGKYVASGGADDRIFVYDMKQRNQTQILQHHVGTVNALEFTPDSSHLLSVGSDGHFVATRIGSWMIEGNWRKAHGGSQVTHLTCHPSGKLALTLGSDLILRTWNLVKGRVAYKTNVKGKKTLGHTPDCIYWSTEGNYFTIAGQRCIEIWSIENADVISTIKTTSRPVCICWIDEEHLLVGLENGKILIHSLSEETEDQKTVECEGHSSRVKCLSYNGNVLVSASSSGEIKLWSIDLEDKKLTTVSSVNIGCRPTCLVILDTSQFGEGYWSETKEEVEEEDDESEIPVTKNEKSVIVIEEEDGVNDEDLIEAGQNSKNTNKRKQNQEDKTSNKKLKKSKNKKNK